jgi:site-specific recombinase XerD
MAPGTLTQLNWILDQNKFLTTEELARLRRVAEQNKNKAMKMGEVTPVRDWFLICVATETGLRVQEIADLRCGDIQTVENVRVVIVRCGKGGKSRPVIVRREFMEQAERFFAWKKKHGEAVGQNDPVFCGRGKPISKRALQKAYRRTIKRAEIVRPHGVGIHALRHTYASHLLKASNFNVPFVQRQMGHASIRTTEIYMHVLNVDAQRSVARLYPGGK